MADEESVFNVVVDGIDVSIDVLAPGADGYERSRERVILRERDAIELFRETRAEGRSMDGVYSFALVENAKAFALLQLKSIEQGVEDNLDRIQAFGV